MTPPSSSFFSSLPKVLIVGSGAVGLRTAQEALHRGCQVVLRSPIHPLNPRNCSVGAGGLWMPFRCDDSRVDRWALETFNELEILYRNTSEQRLVERLPAIYLLHPRHVSTNHINPLPQWTTDPRLQLKTLPLQDIAQRKDVLIPPAMEFHKVGYTHAWLFHPFIVNAPKMLEYMLQHVMEHSNTMDVDVETGEYMESVEHMQDTAKQLGCNTVINCTGLGAAQIIGCESSSSVTHNNETPNLTGARGILFKYNRNTCFRRPQVDQSGNERQDTLIMIDEEPWGSETMPCYLIPRGDHIVVGGSYLPGDMETSIRPTERERLLANAHLLGLDVNRCTPESEWTGFRPKRNNGVRCEADTIASKMGGVQVLHNYGHGGSGWTINVGTARECLDILLRKPNL